MSTNAMTSKKMPKKSGKRVPQHNEPKAKMPKHDGVPKAMRRETPTDKGGFDRAGFNISGGNRKMAGAKKKKR